MAETAEDAELDAELQALKEVNFQHLAFLMAHAPLTTLGTQPMLLQETQRKVKVRCCALACLARAHHA